MWHTAGAAIRPEGAAVPAAMRGSYRRSCRHRAPSRSLAVVRRREQAAGAQQVFDRELKRAQRNRAATASGGGGRGGQSYDYLREEVAARLADRLRDISRTFPRVLDVGAGHGSLLPHLLRDGEFGVETLVQVDSAEKMLWRDVGGEGSGAFAVPDGVDVHRLVRDEECLLPPPPLTPSDDDGDGVADTDGVYEEEAEALLQRGTFDCVLSSMALHWVNDLPGVMVQARKLLKPDGIFLAAMLGGDSLHELRSVLAVAEQEREGGLSPRVSPRVGVDVAGSLLNRAGFTLLTVDTDQLVVPYPDALTLMHDLSAMGEGNAAQLRRPHLPRETLIATAALYEEMYGDRLEDGSMVVPATFELVYMIGWAPAPQQPTALARGSATTSLASGLGMASADAGAGGEGILIDPPGGATGAPKPFSLADIATETGGRVGRVERPPGTNSDV